MSELVSEAKSQQEIEKQIRSIGSWRRRQFRDRHRPEPLAYGRRAGRRVHRVQGLPADQGFVRPRPELVDGPVEVSSAQHVLIKGTMLETTVVVRGAGLSRRSTSPGSCRSCSSRWASATFSASRTPAQARFVTSTRAQPPAAPRVWARRAPSPSRRSTWPRSSSRSRRSPRHCRSRTKCSRTHRASSPTSTAGSPCS